MSIRRVARFAALGCFLAAVAQAGKAAAMEPYQMVRSLQLVQDRIANGDHASLPMQRRLLQLIDQRFRTADAATLSEPHNFRSILIYAMSGGNPVTIDAALSRLKLEGEDSRLGRGVLDYVYGRPAPALSSLGNIQPMTLKPDLGAFVALVKGSLVTKAQPVLALRYFDQARLLAPGSLVEEAALRRSLTAATQAGDAKKFLSLSSQYGRRFLRSPYAAQFADAFVAGVIALHQNVDDAVLDDILSRMEPDHRKAIFLRLAHRAAIEGYRGLAELAAERAAALGGDAPAPDPQGEMRAKLYSMLGAISSRNAAEVSATLDAIDRESLSEADRKLYDAARAVLEGVTSDPRVAAPDPSLPSASNSTAPPPPEPTVAQPSAPPSTPVAVAPPSAVAEPPAAGTQPPAPVDTAMPAADDGRTLDELPDETRTLVDKTRRTLTDIDKMLEDTKG